jgi:aspartate carbamoyltransferase catalytic subunit
MLFQLKRNWESLEGKKIVLIGDIMHSRVALSNIYLLKKMGAEVMVAGPSYIDPKIHQGSIGSKSGI